MTRRVLFHSRRVVRDGFAARGKCFRPSVSTRSLANISPIPSASATQQPRLSWKLRSDRAGEIQTAWEIRAASSAAGFESRSPDLWDSGKIISDQSDSGPLGWQTARFTLAGFLAGARLGQRRPADRLERRRRRSNSDCWTPPMNGRENGSPPICHDTISSNPLWKKHRGSTPVPPPLKPPRIRFAARTSRQRGHSQREIDAAADGLITIYVNGHPTRQGPTSLTAPLHAEFGTQFAPGKNIIAIGSAAVRNAIRRDRGAPEETPSPRTVVDRIGPTASDIEFNTDGSWKAAVATSGDQLDRSGFRRFRLGSGHGYRALLRATCRNIGAAPSARVVICGKILPSRSRSPKRGSTRPRSAFMKPPSTASASATICSRPAGPITPSA